jgi:SagB-type dehydrogenase family enzyme
VPADFLGLEGTSLLDLYIIVNAVEGLTPGAYVFSPQRRELELLAEGNFREDAGHLGFEQALSADASAVVFFMADLGRILARYGNRGYRAAQLEAGILGGRLYLATHSLGLGATGLTFYDDDVTDFFSPHAAGKSLMFVVALGATAERNQVRPFRSRVALRSTPWRGELDRVPAELSPIPVHRIRSASGTDPLGQPFPGTH